MAKRKPRTGWGAAVSKILPGDHIHHQAPTSTSNDTRAMIDALDAAAFKRMRKLEKRKPK